MVLEYKPSTLIGYSVGGMTTIYHQKLHPNPLIKKLIILGPPSELSGIIKDYQKTLGLSDRFMKSWNMYFKENFGMYYDEFSIAKFSKTVQQKGLIIHDKQDAIAPYSASVAIHKNWANSKLVSTDGLGHSLYHSSVENSMIDFLKTRILS